MCQLCLSKTSAWTRRGFILAAGAAASAPVLAQVDVGGPSRARSLVPAQELEVAAAQQYTQLLEQARAKGALAGESHPQLQRLRHIAQRLIPQAGRWNPRAGQWRWEVNLIGSNSINAFCMPGGKIAFFSGLLTKLQLTDDETAMVMGHEMAHALREHARARIAKTQITGTVASIAAQVLGLGQIGDLAANIGTQLLSLKYSRDDENEADLVGLELAARAGYNPDASITLWDKMARASGGGGGPAFISSHPTGPDRMRNLQMNIPRVRGLYEQAIAHR
ncbi:M48 family metallopeptidase [Ramlibacter albus]|uniref:M48 family metallopeptidase n=1 Tax=Ramlibacter albus TaxID=2079448 RepID=A0A923M4S7_9BURK|nr:M48 family metallopeptidase [Ramlibacter albus]MBC5763950.1 M48 family metallopeptidase [Ramlibacter albus]